MLRLNFQATGHDGVGVEIKMSEQLDTATFPKTQVEVMGQGKFSLLVNRDAITASELEHIRRLISKVSIEALQPISDDGTYPHIRVDNKNNPSFVFKERMMFLVRAVDGFIGNDLRLKRMQIAKRADQANNSVLNEMALSTAIGKVVQSSQAQEAVQQFGFDSLQFSSPLLGIINSETARKSIVYRYVQGSPLRFEIGVERGLSSDTARIFIRQLEAIFRSNNIEPFDLRISQFLAEKETLYLLDTEQYFRKFK